MQYNVLAGCDLCKRVQVEFSNFEDNCVIEGEEESLSGPFYFVGEGVTYFNTQSLEVKTAVFETRGVKYLS